jgi:hypothetical protein
MFYSINQGSNYKGFNMKSIIKTLDGYTFYELDNGMIVDSLNSNNIKLSWNSFIEFSYALNGNYIQSSVLL